MSFLASSLLRRAGVASPASPSRLLLGASPSQSPSPLIASALACHAPAPAALFAHQVRHRRAGNSNGVWWQPLLPALAKEQCPDVEGKGNRRKRMQQRQQQRLWNVAIRREGVRRNAVFEQHKREREAEKVKEVYRQYGEMLQEKALRLQQQQQQHAEGAETDATQQPQPAAERGDL